MRWVGPSGEIRTAPASPDNGSGRQVREKLAPTLISFSGTVKDRNTGEPVHAFRFRLKRKIDRWNSLELVYDTVRDKSGRFTFPLQEGGLHQVHVSAVGYYPLDLDNISVDPVKGLSDLTVELDPVYGLSGRVVDATTGRPLEGVFVVAGLKEDGTEAGFDDGVDTDEDGRFSLKGLRRKTYTVTACHPDYAERSVDALPGPHEITFRLQKILAFRVFGTALDDKGVAKEGIQLNLYRDDRKIAPTVETDEKGAYITAPVSPGWIEVRASISGGERWQRAYEFTRERRRVLLTDHDVEVNFGQSRKHVTWKGTLYGFDGRPVTSPWGQIQVVLAASRDPAESALVSQTVWTDMQGKFEVRKLVPGSYRVHLEFTPVPLTYRDRKGVMRMGLQAVYQSYEWEPVTFDVPGTVEKDIRPLGGEIRGVVIDPSTGDPIMLSRNLYGRVTAYNRSGRSFSAYLNREGSFRFPGLPPGSYNLHAKLSEHAEGTAENIRLDKDQALEDVRILLPLSGRVLVHFLDFAPYDPRPFRLHFKQVDGKGSHDCGTQYVRRRGGWSLDYDFEVGSWILSLDGGEMGRVERLFDLFEGKTTEVLIRGGDFPNYGDR